MTAVLARIRSDESADVAAYVAVSAAGAGALAETIGTGDIELLSWDILPGVQSPTADGLAGRPPRAVAILGTVEHDEWVTWHLPVPPPAVPAA